MDEKKDIKNKNNSNNFTMKYTNAENSSVSNVSNNANNEIDEFEIKDLSIEDAKLNANMDVKVDTETSKQTGDINKDTKAVDSINNDKNLTDSSTSVADNSKKEQSNFNDNNVSNNNVQEDSGDTNTSSEKGESNSTKEDVKENDNSNDFVDKSDKPEDTRSLKEKVKDTKDKLKDTKDKIKNAPENIKNKIDDTKKKIEDTKDKLDKAKEKVKNAPENIKNKAEKAKESWNNRPRNMKDFKDRAKSSGSNLKDKLKNRGKNAAKNLGNKAKDAAKEGFKNSELGQQVQKAKDTIDKTKRAVKTTKKVVQTTAKVATKATSAIVNFLVATFPWLEIILGIFLLIAAIIILISALMPGSRGNVNEQVDGEKYSEFSKVDKKTLEKLEKIFSEYPNVDGALAMATVLLPYYSNLHDGNVSSYLTGTSDEEFEENLNLMLEDDANLDFGQKLKKYSLLIKNGGSTLGEIAESEFKDWFYNTFGYEIKDTDTEDIEDDEEDDEDLYLMPFRKWTVRADLKAVLKKLNENNESNFKAYLKDKYFSNDDGYLGYDKDIQTGYNGYKKLFKAQIDDSKEDELKELVVQNIYDIKDMFTNYVYLSPICTSTLEDAGTINTDELLKGNVLVDLKKPGCSNINSCQESYYSTYLTLEEYVKGVVYEEISGEINEQKIAAQMVAAKTYTLSRRPSSIKVDSASGAYVIPMLWSTADQDFCHVEKGCNAENITAYHGYNRGDDTRLFHGANRPPASDAQKELYNKAWEASKNVYVVNEDGSPAKTSYWLGESCKPGTCMDQSQLASASYDGSDFKNILGYFYSSYLVAEEKGEFATLKVTDSTNCVPVGGVEVNTCALQVKDGIYYKTAVPQTQECQVTGFYDENSWGLEPNFYANLMAFIENGKKQGCNAHIISGHRTRMRQQYFYNCYLTKSCNNGYLAAAPGYGNHEYAIAADLSYFPYTQKCISYYHNTAASFGLKYSVPSENWHIEPSNIVKGKP